MAATLYEKKAMINMMIDWLADLTTLFDATELAVQNATAADDTDLLALSQTAGSGGALSLEAAQPTVARLITITSPDNMAGVAFEVVGTDRDDAAQTESAITGPNNSTVSTTNYFKTVTAINHDIAITNVEAGVGEIDSAAIYSAYQTAGSFKGSVNSLTIANALASINAEANP